MKKFLKKLFLFSLPLFVVWAAIEFFYRYEPNNYSYKNQIIPDNYDAEVLIFGNSHAYYGLNPENFTNKAFNIANVSQGLYFDELLFDKYVDVFTKCKVLILAIDYFTLTEEDNNPDVGWRKYFYIEQMHIDVPGVCKLDPRCISLTLAPRFDVTLAAIKRRIEEGSLVDSSDKGWGRHDGVNIELNNAFTAMATVQHHEDANTDINKNMARLKKIILGCKQRNIKIILVTMPVTSYYRDNIKPKKLLTTVKICNKLANEKDVYYLNLFNNKRITNSDFYDANHLNACGAKKCSQIIDEAIQKNVQ